MEHLERIPEERPSEPILICHQWKYWYTLQMVERNRSGLRMTEDEEEREHYQFQDVDNSVVKSIDTMQEFASRICKECLKQRIINLNFHKE
jgi:hypothetical protein